MRQKINRGGYPFVHLGYKGPTPMVHRLVAEAFVPGQAPGLEVAHLNGERVDCRAENLAWKTRKENIADKKKHGTWGKKLSEEQVREIRDTYAAGGTTQKELGERYGVAQATISKITRRDRWRD